jgi:molybdopterin/thiamine biosynthesis adenylyltransferase
MNDGDMPDIEIELEGQAPAAPAQEPTAPEQLDVELEEDRYDRLRLIPWWDQDKLQQARVMVVGAGALGNEIIKNLAMLGVGRLVIIDFDLVENSNLSRSVLFRESDEGRNKAQVAARSARELNPDVRAQPLMGNIVYDVGLGVFREMDVVIGGLDNREARLAINQNCWRVNRPWIDGAIEVLHGVARVFRPPDGPCYECTMSEMDYKLLNMRRSCALLTKDEMLKGRVPTTPTVASVIGGIQVQEAVKLIHNRPDMPVLAGKGFMYNGVTHDSYVVEYQRREDCYSHETFEEVIELDRGVADSQVGDILDIIRAQVTPSAVLEFEREIVYELYCEHCHTRQPIFRALGKVTVDEGRCPDCGQMRLPEMTHSVDAQPEFMDMTLEELGVPPYDIVRGRQGLTMKHFLLAKDRREALGTAA